jgi:hypothetical protein
MKYLAVYRLNMIPLDMDHSIVDEKEIYVGINAGPIYFSYAVPLINYNPPSTSYSLGQMNVNIPKGKYLKILINIDENDFSNEIKKAPLKVAEIASLFDLQYPHIITDKLYAGPINDPSCVIFRPQGPLTITAQPVRTPDDIKNVIIKHIEILKVLGQNSRERYQLAARWFRKGFETVNQIDKLISWWTVLEIYPATGSANIPKHVCNLLVNKLYKKLTPSELKIKLKLGQICGLRCKIIHDGKAFVEDKETNIFSDYLERLQAIDTVCLRLLIGLEPGNELDKYIN